MRPPQQPLHETPDARSSAAGGPATQDDLSADWSRRVVLANLGVALMSTSAAASPVEREQNASHPGETRDRYAIGLDRLHAIDGRDGEAVVEGLKKIAPDFARYLIEFPFGDIYARPGLDLRAREIATIAALTALGNARPQLEVHVAAGLNVGLTEQEIIEIVMQMAVYAGFPAAINGLNAAKAVFDRHATT